MERRRGGGAGRRGGGRRVWRGVVGRRTATLHVFFAPSGCVPLGRARTQTGWVRGLPLGEANADGAAFGFPIFLLIPDLMVVTWQGPPKEKMNKYLCI